PRARHVEVQIFGDGAGEVVALGERDCSVQRRNQKAIEETPAPRLSLALRDAMLDDARRLGRAASYRSAGTVEFIVDADRAEDPLRSFQPSAGVLTEVVFPAGVRVEAAVERGSEVTPFYDPMIGKLIARGATRDEARTRLLAALAATRVAGVTTNRDYLIEV